MEGVGRFLPAGNYEVVTDEELIEGLSFPVYRRVATIMLAPTQTSHSIFYNPQRSAKGARKRQEARGEHYNLPYDPYPWCAQYMDGDK
jgi:hypothetical protein